MAVASQAAKTLLDRVTCPHCWQKFLPEDVLWVAAHKDLLGDPMLGRDASVRFLPTRFNIDGNAIDAKNFRSTELACPKCHLTIPEGLLELEPTFISITGAPASGKSVYLTSMVGELRQRLGTTFSLTFEDADTLSNQRLNGYEEQLFHNSNAEELTPLGSLIPKTDVPTTGEMFNQVHYGNQLVSYPKPFLFSVLPNRSHVHTHKASTLGRVLCLYDNAGEHFQPGQDTTGSPVTRHLAEAASLLFVFDPTMDGRFRDLCQARQELRKTSGRDSYSIRQEPILHEVANRVRRHARLRQSERHKRPLIVILTKYDLWYDLLDVEENTEPWKEVAVRGDDGSTSKRCALDIPRIEAKSQKTRELLLRVSPEIVNAAEGFADEVLYVPVSALGWATTVNNEGQLSIRPVDVYPYWVTVPILYSFTRCLPGLVPVLKRKA